MFLKRVNRYVFRSDLNSQGKVTLKLFLLLVNLIVFMFVLSKNMSYFKIFHLVIKDLDGVISIKKYHVLSDRPRSCISNYLAHVAVEHNDSFFCVAALPILNINFYQFQALNYTP